jgi:hypothetical protein
MPLRPLITLSVLLLSVSGTPWALSLPDWDDLEAPVAAENPPVAADLSPSTSSPPSMNSAVSASSFASAASANPAPAESQGSSNRMGAGLAAHSEFAPLALFSLGSLAVGGAFYAINVSSSKSNVSPIAGGRSNLTHAVGVAGLTALLAAGSYFYFSREDAESDSDSDSDSDLDSDSNWDAQVSGGIAPDGALSAGALLTFPLSSLFR